MDTIYPKVKLGFFSAAIDAISDAAGCSLRTTFYRHFCEKYGLSPEEF